MYSSMALKVGVRAHLDPHNQKMRGSGPQDTHRIAATDSLAYSSGTMTYITTRFCAIKKKYM